MSSTIIYDFFPDTAKFLKLHIPYVWDLVFPETLQHMCPEPYWTPSYTLDFSIRNPWLLPFTMLGIVVGLMGFLQLRSTTATNLYSWAACFFACMNAAAIHSHCLTSPDAPGHTLSKALDVGFTSASSLNLILAALYKASPSIIKGFYLHQISRWLSTLVILLAIIANYTTLPWMNELLYLGMTAIAVQAIYIFETMDACAPQTARSWMRFACFGGFVGMSGLPLDRRICQYIGNSINHVHLLFLGCDLAFLGVIQYVKHYHQRLHDAQKQE